VAEKKQFVAFKLEDEEYAVEILNVQEIIRWSHITRVPKAPPFIKGVINLRGKIIPVIDSHVRFRLGEQVITEMSRIIVFHYDDVVIGMTVDLVTEVLSLPVEDIEKPHTSKSIDNQFIQGIGKIGDRLLIVLDLSKVLDLSLQ
jgi:purine-binding chemotaxis protein CheW